MSERCLCGTTTPRVGISFVHSSTRQRAYLDAVRAAGGEPIVLATDRNAAASRGLVGPGRSVADHPAVRRLEGLDGILLTGGDDVDPGYYGEPNTRSEISDPPRDQLEFAQIRLAVEHRLPILGICRGAQVLNVAYGGSLVQHLPTAHLHAAGSDRSPSKAHLIRVFAESAVARLLGESVGGSGLLAVNSRHHQGVTPDRLAPGLVAAAYSLVENDEHPVIEALETPTTRAGREFIVGIQWHPERISDIVAPARDQSAEFCDLSQRLFEAFIAAARDRGTFLR